MCVDGAFEYNVKAAANSSNPEIAVQSINSLGFVPKERLPGLLKSIETFKRQDMYSIFASACIGPNADISIWEYFKEKLPFYLDLFMTTSFILPTMCRFALSLARDENDLAEMKQFFEKNPVPIAEVSIKTSVEKLKNKFERQKLHGEEIRAALTQ